MRLSKKIFYKDIILNIVASMLLTLATQLISYPYLSRLLSPENYGLMLTVMGIINVVGVSLGNSLNNTRLLLQTEYENKRSIGDYNIIFFIILLLNVLIITVITYILYNEFNLMVVGSIIVTSLLLFRSYYSVAYRIVLNYKKVLFLSIFGFTGYLFGVFFTHITGVWIFTFLFGELFACIYLFFTANIVREKFVVTSLFNRTVKKYIYLLFAAILSTLIMYMDRFYIYPMLGAEQVAIFNVASFLGKTIGIIIIPVTGVLLSYYSKETILTLKQFYQRIAVFTIFTIACYILIITTGIPIIKVLYPTLAQSSLPYFYIANLATAIFLLGNTIQPILLRFCDSKWQLIIQGIYFCLYIIFGFIGMSKYGLLGFCYSLLTVNTLKIILMVFIVNYNLKKSSSKW